MTELERENIKNRKIKKYNAFLIIFFSLLIFYLCTNGYISGLTEGYKSLLYDWLGKRSKFTTSYGPRSLDNALDNLSALSGQIFISIFSISFGGYLFLRKRYRTLYTYFLVVIGAGLVHVFLKNFYAGEPWYNWFDIFGLESKSFPSGHALMSIVFYFTMARLIYRSNPDTNLNNYLMSVALVLSIAIGIAQVIRGAHSPNDVIAGWAIGFAWVSGAWLLDHYIRKRIFIRQQIRNGDSAST